MVLLLMQSIIQFDTLLIFTVDSTTPSSEIFSKMQDFPQLKTTGINIGRDWLTWKKHFLSFLQKEDPKELYKDQWVTFFLMLIGPLGEQVYKDLSSRDAQRLKDFKTLFSNLDLYFIFGSRKKQKDENVESYIDKLMVSHYFNIISIIHIMNLISN